MDLLAWAAVAALGTNGLVEVWHHAELFAGPRARAEAGDGFVSRLLSCPFCLSVWAGWAAVAALAAPWWLAGAFGPDWGWPGHLPRLFVCGVAAARAAQLVNDLTHAAGRTPHRKGGPAGLLAAYAPDPADPYDPA